VHCGFGANINEHEDCRRSFPAGGPSEKNQTKFGAKKEKNAGKSGHFGGMIQRRKVKRRQGRTAPSTIEAKRGNSTRYV